MSYIDTHSPFSTLTYFIIIVINLKNRFTFTVDQLVCSLFPNYYTRYNFGNVTKTKYNSHVFRYSVLFSPTHVTQTRLNYSPIYIQKRLTIRSDSMQKQSFCWCVLHKLSNRLKNTQVDGLLIKHYILD